MLDHYVNLISIFHVEVLGGLIFMKSLAVEKEPDIVGLELNETKGTDCRWQ